jgi:chemotaxis protein methyltransferase CheR
MYFIELEDREFNRFREIIYTEAGIKLSDMKKALVQSRLSMRIRLLGLKSYEEYYGYLIEHYDDEKINFINAITTNKTEFFREHKHFEYLRDVFLPDLIREKPKEILIWSAGCSTGEEAYSIAMTILEFFKLSQMPAVKILATDIDTNVLKSARCGIYNDGQIDKLDQTLLKRYFYKGIDHNAGTYRVKEKLSGMIYFRRLNLQNEVFPMKKQFDIIFCRNVIIYFDKDTQSELFEKFYKYLAGWGRLFIGHSENITNVTNKFTLIGNTIYRKSVL